VSAKRERVSVR